MSVIPFTGVVSFSAEHPNNRVRNLLSGGSGKWSCPASYPEKSMEVELSLPPCYIEGLDIGNFGSANLEVQVNRSTDPVSKRETLILNATLMSRIDCVRGVKREAMVFLGKDKMNSNVVDKWWDRIRIVCHQPFRTSNFDSFGISTIVVRGRKLHDDKNSSSLELVGLDGTTKRLGSGAEDLLKKVDRQLPSVSKQVTNPTVNALENSRFFSSNQEQILSSPLSRAGRLVQQGCTSATNLSKLNIEQKFGDVAKYSISSRKRLRDFDETSLDRKPDISSRNNVTLFDASFSPATNSLKSLNMKDSSSKKLKSNLMENDSTLSPKKSTTLARALFTSRIHDSNVIKQKEQQKKQPEIVKKSESDSLEVMRTATQRTVMPEKRKNTEISDFDNPTEFKRYPKEELASHGIIVQTRQYKNVKQLPVVGGKKVTAERGQVVTFYKKRRNIYMEIAGVVYRPDVEPEHVGAIFKGFTEEELARNDRGELSHMKCLLCDKSFLTQDELVIHCSDCNGDEPSSPSPPSTPPPTVRHEACPICNVRFPSEQLQSHAELCAQSMFDVEDIQFVN